MPVFCFIKEAGLIFVWDFLKLTPAA